VVPETHIRRLSELQDGQLAERCPRYLEPHRDRERISFDWKESVALHEVRLTSVWSCTTMLL
jgi:hypothetical protein